MILTVGDITSLVSSTSREEFSHASATSREVSSATASVVVAGTAAASATTPVVTDVTSLCRQAGTLNPAGQDFPVQEVDHFLISLSHGVAGSSPQMLKSPVILGSVGGLDRSL